MNVFIERFEGEIAKSVLTLKAFEENIAKQDNIIAVNVANIAQAHERIDRRTDRIKVLEDENREMKKTIRDLDHKVGEVSNGLYSFIDLLL